MPAVKRCISVFFVQFVCYVDAGDCCIKKPAFCMGKTCFRRIKNIPAVKNIAVICLKNVFQTANVRQEKSVLE